MDESFYRAFLADAQAILLRLNPRAGRDTGNCPAVAAAVDAYLSSGVIRPAPASMSGFGFEVPALTRAPIRAILASLRQSGDHVVVAADEGDRHHEFNLLRVGSEIYYVDGYNRPGVVSTNVTGHTSWARRFEYGRTYSARLVPTR